MSQVPKNPHKRIHSKKMPKTDDQHINQLITYNDQFANDPFFNNFIDNRNLQNPFQDIYKFSNIHKDFHSQNTQGSYIFQSYISSSKIGSDGKILKQDYFQNSIGQHQGNKTISQKQQAYKNNQGVNRIGEQRMLNDKGRKIVKEKIGNNVQEINHYYNIDQDQAGQFDSQWKQTDKNMGFLNHHRRQLEQQDQPQLLQIDCEPHQLEQKQQKGKQQKNQPHDKTQKIDHRISKNPKNKIPKKTSTSSTINKKHQKP